MNQESKSTLTPKFIITAAVVTVWVLFQLYLAIIKPLDPMFQATIHLLFALAVVFIHNPADKKSGKAWMKIIDIPFFAGILFIAYYIVSQRERLSARVQYVDVVMMFDKISMIVLMIVLMEAVRRTLGIILFLFIGFFIIYAWFGNFFPGLLNYRGTNLRQFTELMTMGTSGILGTPLYTSSSSLFYFIIFGVFFSECGGGQLLIDLGMKLSNKSSGGPAKAAIISSGLMGMISGSAVANVSTTGVMTIPMMKKVGYAPEQAGAIEAVASTGGQIMPPIMGVGAFIMAEMLGVPYKTVAFSAIIPAIAYYLSVLFLVTFIADKKHITEGASDITFDADPILPRLYLLLPAIVLVYFMVSGSSLMRSGMMGIYTAILVNIASKFIAKGKYFVTPKKLGQTLMQGVKQAAEIAIPTGACGIIIGVVIQSGLATKVSSIIAEVGGSNLVLALIITTLGCMLLGMALPTVAAYLVSNVLFVPVLIKLGIAPLPANMFVFYFGIMAQITPPVCLASFTAAGIAGADSLKTGWTGFKYALVAFFCPFIFVYDPGILLIGTTFQIVKATAVLFLGTYLLAASMAGFLMVSLSKPERIILFIAAIGLIVPEPITDIIGLAVGVAFWVICFVRKKRSSNTMQKENVKA